MKVSEFMGQAADFDEVSALVAEASTVAICAHTSPDGDAIGSVLALAEAIETHWPGTKVTCLLADADPVPRVYRFLPGAGRFVHAADYHDDPDLFFCVDLSQPGRLADAEAVMRRAAKIAVLDHHPAPMRFWDAGVVRPSAAAAGVIVTEYIQWARCELTPTMAQCLFCAVVTDTGRFQYQNADTEAFDIAGVLVDAGANPADVALHVYQSDRLCYLHLIAKVMARITTFEHGRIAYSYATAADFAAEGVPVDETDGLIDIVRCVDGTEVALFLKEVGSGKVRGNLRAKTDHDVSAIARALGGGGHRAASGFTFEGSLDEALSVALPKLCALFSTCGSSREGEAR